mgnify:CR=1 FL=1
MRPVRAYTIPNRASFQPPELAVKLLTGGGVCGGGFLGRVVKAKPMPFAVNSYARLPFVAGFMPRNTLEPGFISGAYPLVVLIL